MKIEASSHHKCRAWTVFGKKGEGWWKFSNCFYAFAHLVLRKFSLALSLLRVKLWNGSTHENQNGSKYVCFPRHMKCKFHRTRVKDEWDIRRVRGGVQFYWFWFSYSGPLYGFTPLMKMWVEELYKIVIFILLILCLFLGSSNSLVVNVGHPV